MSAPLASPSRRWRRRSRRPNPVRSRTMTSLLTEGPLVARFRPSVTLFARPPTRRPRHARQSTRTVTGTTRTCGREVVRDAEPRRRPYSGRAQFEVIHYEQHPARSLAFTRLSPSPISSRRCTIRPAPAEVALWSRLP